MSELTELEKFVVDKFIPEAEEQLDCLTNSICPDLQLMELLREIKWLSDKCDGLQDRCDELEDKINRWMKEEE